jgi:hypothetical protein
MAEKIQEVKKEDVQKTKKKKGSVLGDPCVYLTQE